MIRRSSAQSLRQVLRVAIYALAGAFVLLAVAAPALQAQADGALSGQLKISANQSIYVIGRGNQATGTLTTTICCGFNYNVYLSASGLPAGSTMVFSPGVIPAPGSGTSKMTIWVGINTKPGSYPITILATGGGVKATTKIYVLVP